MILPLPFRRREGRGEGSDLTFRAAKCIKRSGALLRKKQCPGSGSSCQLQALAQQVLDLGWIGLRMLSPDSQTSHVAGQLM